MWQDHSTAFKAADFVVQTSSVPGIAGEIDGGRVEGITEGLLRPWEVYVRAAALTALLGLCPHRAQLFHELQHTANNSLWADTYSKQPKWGINELAPAVNGCGEARFGPDDHREQVLSDLGSVVSSFANTLWFLLLSRTANKHSWALSDLLPVFLPLFLLNVVEFSWTPSFFVSPLNCSLSITS